VWERETRGAVGGANAQSPNSNLNLAAYTRPAPRPVCVRQNKKAF